MNLSFPSRKSSERKIYIEELGVSKRTEKWKQVIQDRNARNEEKTKAFQGLVSSGINPQIVKVWALAGSKTGGVDSDTRIRQLKWVVSTRSGMTGEQRKRAVQELLQFGVRSEVISEWARS